MKDPISINEIAATIARAWYTLLALLPYSTATDSGGSCKWVLASQNATPDMLPRFNHRNHPRRSCAQANLRIREYRGEHPNLPNWNGHCDCKHIDARKPHLLSRPWDSLADATEGPARVKLANLSTRKRRSSTFATLKNSPKPHSYVIRIPNYWNWALRDGQQAQGKWCRCRRISGQVSKEAQSHSKDIAARGAGDTLLYRPFRPFDSLVLTGRVRQDFDLSKGESRDSTTAYGHAFLEQIRRTADKRYRLWAFMF